ncbi:hypothetical protein JW868_04120 [Candidatus Woesearchaeota archaeon]|nr:hypothetical protein [Candidatus Woesearchaeota archaeon]
MLATLIDILVLFGGGGASYDQIVYLLRLLDSFKDKKISIVTGPLFSSIQFSELEKKHPNIRFIKQYNHSAELIPQAKMVISHCGYNTLLESLMNSRHVLMYPRRNIRKEQIYRAKYFKKLNYADYIDSTQSDSVNFSKIRNTFEKKYTVPKLKQCLNSELFDLFWL